uniref:Cell division control protein n=1 Tax=Nicotiana tabacum TaxID=4097 RepID=A0A1S4CPQ9_TOBAC|nr:PREDICTED: cell division control protein 6 homolog B-like isoform X1 [Nicotiana tabacum]XP_016503227.1 PREDICTED: cell division control protein 6 homolog B-like isoform X1 [Nicotiana tabacum]XP_016503228.1 PREDICTED: cell division control protein 6 homolog B-like isoform X1 [Nicotiana tabacum]
MAEIQLSTPQKRKLRSNSTPSPMQSSCAKWKSPRRCVKDCPKSHVKMQGNFGDKTINTTKSPVKKRLSESFLQKPMWNPRDVEQLNAVKEALHVSTPPATPTVVCREVKYNRVLDFCKESVEQDKAGSLYICGCPGTGKSLSIEKVKEVLVDWANESALQAPDLLSLSCTSLSKTSDIFGKILDKIQPRRKANGSMSPLQYLQKMSSQKQQSTGRKMMLIIVDEMDYLITKDRTVLHDLFMLTTFPFSRFILIGIANAIDLADRFLPKLQSLNYNPFHVERNIISDTWCCTFLDKPAVITYRAYSKDQIISILQQRLEAFPYTVFQPQALELCARKVASTSGDMGKALSVCRSAIEMLEGEIRDSIYSLQLPSLKMGLSDQQRGDACDKSPIQESGVVRVDHVAIALSKAYRSPVVDTIQSLPQHQQIILCSALKLFRGKKKDATIGELNISYVDVCKSTLIPPVGIMELSNMCRVLGDQGILKVGQAREDKLRRVTLKIDEADITFALQGIRLFRNYLQQL